MSVLPNPKHEAFAVFCSKGVSACKAYTLAGYSQAGSRQSAAKLLTNPAIVLRVRELQETVSAAVIQAEICDRNARVAALQDRWDRMRKVILERAEAPEYLAAPGGTTGLMARDFRGKNADREIFKVDCGLLRELRAHEEQAAKELGQWQEQVTVTVTDLAARLQAGRTRLAKARP
jgi:hypothetical protein